MEALRPPCGCVLKWYREDEINYRCDDNCRFAEAIFHIVALQLALARATGEINAHAQQFLDKVKGEKS